GHVEAGLGTDSPSDPFPEELNRRLTSALASVHFAPTERARRALLAEGVADHAIVLTGNTVVDAITQIRRTEAYRVARPPLAAARGERIVRVRLHRRARWGEPAAGVGRAIPGVRAHHGAVRAGVP